MIAGKVEELNSVYLIEFTKIWSWSGFGNIWIYYILLCDQSHQAKVLIAGYDFFKAVN